MLRAIDAHSGSFVTRSALQLAPLVFVRPGELRMAEWAEFTLEEAEWRIPATRRKMRAPHFVPLSSQAVEIPRELQPLTGSGRFVFPGERSRDRPMSNNTVNAALRLPERRKMMQAWADYLYRLRSTAAVIPPKNREMLRGRSRLRTPAASQGNA